MKRRGIRGSRNHSEYPTRYATHELLGCEDGALNRSQLLAALARDGVDPGAFTSEPQIELALRFAELYERHALIRDGIAPPLWHCCPNAGSCWRTAWDTRPKDGPEDGGISLPWIGPEYRPGGVVVLGINLNDANGLTRAYEINPEDAHELTAGRRRVNYGVPAYRGSDFPYRSTRSAALLADYLDGARITDREDPVAVAPFIDRILRLQSIKCSPRSDDASKPTAEMWANCPPLLLEDELRIAAPGTVVAFGANVRWTLEQLTGYSIEMDRDQVRYGSLRLDQSIPVYLLAHPRSAQWPGAHAALAALLREQRQ